MTLTIPTTIFVKKIVYAERGLFFTKQTEDLPISIDKSDDLLDLLLRNLPRRNRQKQDPAVRAILRLDLPGKYAKLVSSDAVTIGVYLDRHHKREMCKYVLTRQKSNVPRPTALAEYYELYHLDDDDFSEESAIKCIQRYKTEKKHAKNAIKKHKTVLPLLRFSETPAKYSDAELDAMFDTYFARYPRYFKTKHREASKTLPTQCRAWVYRHIGNRSLEQIAKKFNIDRATAWRQQQAFAYKFAKRPKPIPSLDAL